MSGDNSRDRDVPRAPQGAMPLDPLFFRELNSPASLMLTLTSFFQKLYTDSKEPTEHKTYHLEEKKGNLTQ